MVCYIAAFAEAAIILTSVLPSSSRSEHVRSLFMLHPDGGARLYASPSFLLGTALLGAGGFIRWKCYHALGHMFTFEMCIRKDHQLVTTGPYSVVRHPGYVGVIFMVVGLLFWHAGEVGISIRVKKKIQNGLMNIYPGLMDKRVWNIRDLGWARSSHFFLWTDVDDYPWFIDAHVKRRRGPPEYISEGLGYVGRRRPIQADPGTILIEKHRALQVTIELYVPIST